MQDFMQVIVLITKIFSSCFLRLIVLTTKIFNSYFLRLLLLARKSLSSCIPARNFLFSFTQVRNFLFSIIFFSSLTFASTQLPNDFSQYQAKYDLHWHGLPVGKSTHTIKKIAPNHYKVESHSVPSIPVPLEDYEVSEFITEQYRVQPRHYQFKTYNKRKKLVGSFKFDWTQSKVEKSIVGEPAPTVFIVPPLTHDKITHFFQLRRDLQLKKKLNYTVLEPKGIKPYSYKIVAKEDLKTPIGTLKTIVLEHISANKKRKTRVWVAENMDYIMVKLIQIKDDKITAEALIEKFDKL